MRSYPVMITSDTWEQLAPPCCTRHHTHEKTSWYFNSVLLFGPILGPECLVRHPQMLRKLSVSLLMGQRWSVSVVTSWRKIWVVMWECEKNAADYLMWCERLKNEAIIFVCLSALILHGGLNSKQQLCWTPGCSWQFHLGHDGDIREIQQVKIF